MSAGGSAVLTRLLALAVLAAAAWSVHWLLREDEGAQNQTAEPPRGFPRFESSLQCRECHPAVFDEWLGSHHQIAYRNPEVRALSEDFRNKECQACHLPRPVAVTGYASRTLPRKTTPDEGVSCLTCHLDAGGRILGRGDNDQAPCRPKASLALTSVGLCESCHNQHWTTDQWRASTYPAAGLECNDCHMAEVARPSPNGTTRPGLHHGFPASHDRTVLRQAMEFTGAVNADGLVLTLRNTGAGHNLPTEERSRALDVMVRFVGADGVAGEWEQAYRFRLPYRDEPLPDTTLPAGETKTIPVPRRDGAVAVEAALWYRLSPYSTDGDRLSTRLFAGRYELLDAAGNPVTRDEAPVAESPDTELDGKPPWVPDRDQSWVEEQAALLADAIVTTAETATSATTASLELQPRLAGFEALANTARPAPEEGEARQLMDLVEASFVPGLADQRLARRSLERLLQEERVAYALEQGLTHDDPAVRSHCAYHLAEHGDQATLLPLLLQVKNEQSAEPLVWLATTITRLGNHSVLPHLRWLMQNEITANQAGLTAIEVCQGAGIETGEAPTYAELDAHLAELFGRWQELGVTADEPVEALPETVARIARHLTHLEQFQLREVDEARFVLARLGTLAVPMLRDAVQAEEPYLRTHALETLQALGPAAAAAGDAVVPLLQDPLTRVDAARALGHLGRVADAEALRASLDSMDVELRAAAAEALGRLGDPADAARLRALWQDPTQPLDVQVRAAYGLARLDPEDPARAWLQERLTAGDYHTPTLQELLDDLTSRDEPAPAISEDSR